jgi:hypothetical protein
MSIIMSTYRALVVVTPEIEELRRCPECEGDGEYIHHAGAAHGILPCDYCNRTGLNPDQTAWWEALAKAKLNEVGSLFLHKHIVVFKEFPLSVGFGSAGHTHEDINRPEGDSRPWPDVLKELVSKHLFGACEEYNIDECPDECGAECSAPLEKGIDSIPFALATPETAPVFKEFGIRTLVEA